jgi:hypothetical protein
VGGQTYRGSSGCIYKVGLGVGSLPSPTPVVTNVHMRIVHKWQIFITIFAIKGKQHEGEKFLLERDTHDVIT